MSSSLSFADKPHVSSADLATRDRCTALRLAVRELIAARMRPEPDAGEIEVRKDGVTLAKLPLVHDLLTRGGRFDDCGWRFTIDSLGEVHVSADPAYLKARRNSPYLMPRTKRPAWSRRKATARASAA